MAKEEAKYVKLKTQGIFDLQNISKEFNLTSAELVAFHNQYCSIHELLPLKLPKYVEYIYLPPENFLARDKKLLKNTKLSAPNIESDKTYGIEINFQPNDLSIHYKINIKRTTQFLEIKKEKTFINNQEIDQTIEQLFEKAEQVLYPLQILQNEQGEISKIINSKETASRWKQDCRPKLAEYYQSETSDKILNQLDSAFKEVDKNKELLVRNLFYKLFFLPVYQNYPQFLKQDNLQIYFSAISKEIDYKVEYTLNKEFTRGNKIALQISGIEQEDIFNKNIKKGELDFLYKFDKGTMEIFSITGFATKSDENEMYKVDFQLFDLKNNT